MNETIPATEVQNSDTSDISWKSVAGAVAWGSGGSVGLALDCTAKFTFKTPITSKAV